MIATGRVPEAVELLDNAWNVVGPFVRLDHDEEEFVAGIHQGIVQPELLFPNDKGQAKLIATHPVILWKVENVRRHQVKPRNA